MIFYIFLAVIVRSSHPFLSLSILYPFDVNPAGISSPAGIITNPAFVSQNTIEAMTLFYFGIPGYGSFKLKIPGGPLITIDGKVSSGYGLPGFFLSAGDGKRNFHFSFIGMENTFLDMEHSFIWNMRSKDSFDINVTNIQIPSLPLDVSINSTLYITKNVSLNNELTSSLRIKKTFISMGYAERKENISWGASIFFNILSLHTEFNYMAYTREPLFDVTIVSKPGSEWFLNLHGRTHILYELYEIGGGGRIDITKVQMGLNIGWLYEKNGIKIGGSFGQCIPGIVAGEMRFYSVSSIPREGAIKWRVEGVDVDYDNKRVTGNVELYITDTERRKDETVLSGSYNTFPSTLLNLGVILSVSPLSIGTSFRYRGNILTIKGEEYEILHFIRLSSYLNVTLSFALEYFNEEIGWGMRRFSLPSLYYGLSLSKKIKSLSLSIALFNSSEVTIFKSLLSGRGIPFPNTVALGVLLTPGT